MPTPRSAANIIVPQKRILTVNEWIELVEVRADIFRMNLDTFSVNSFADFKLPVGVNPSMYRPHLRRHEISEVMFEVGDSAYQLRSDDIRGIFGRLDEYRVFDMMGRETIELWGIIKKDMTLVGPPWVKVVAPLSWEDGSIHYRRATMTCFPSLATLLASEFDLETKADPLLRILMSIWDDLRDTAEEWVRSRKRLLNEAEKLRDSLNRDDTLVSTIVRTL